ncbi:DNA mismatch repair protein MSH2 [Nematocida sp. AWRm78]|nr:DNA mismatch repair protein MSH2 [Nematocida sp. AWRm79]KAI5182618.1 DNA mismatch repair protein MSH2 [Nematocida sp. AWRm78]
MVKVYLQEDSYMASGSSARIFGEILNERVENSIKMTRDTFYKTIPIIINQYKETLQEYAEINGKEVKMREGSPGNWADYSEFLVGDKDIARIGSVILKKAQQLEIEIASVSTIDKEARIYSFGDNELFTNLAQLIHAENIQEVIYTDESLVKVFTALGITHYKIQKKSTSTLELLEQHLTISTQGYSIKNSEMGSVLRMDDKAADSLLSGDIRIENEINCSTPQGKRLLQLFIRAPSTDKAEIIKKQQIVTELLEKNSELKKAVKSTPDAFTICKRSGVLTLQNIIKIHKFLCSIQQIEQCILEVESLSHEKALIKDSLDYTQDLINDIEEVVCIKTKEIKENCTEQLVILNRVKKEQEQEIYTEYTEVVTKKGLSISKCKLEKTPMHGYCVKIPRIEEGRLTTEIKLTTQKSGVLFTTDAIKLMNYKISNTESQIKAEHALILKTLTESFSICKGWIEVLNHTVAFLDVFTSLAEYAANNNLVCPKFSDGIYQVQQMYHPLLPALYRKRLIRTNGIEEPIKNDLEIVEDKRVCIITGPNMGGKTTFLKTVGVISILAQIGSYVPAAYAHIPIFHQLFIRIGASDNPDKGISTFMAEMMDVSTILNQATEKSLVIIDELGRGTSDEDGYAIAASTVEYISRLKAMTLFATHFHELAHMPGIINKRVGSVEEENGLIMTYKIEDGFAKSSHGINTARRMGFPDEVLLMAEKALKSQEE